MKLLIISDIHGNKEALDAVLEVEHDAVVCLGDLVDYGPAPAECINHIWKAGIYTIMGNHDNAVAFKVDCGCRHTYKHLSVATQEQLDDSHIEYLKGLPADTQALEIIRCEYDIDLVCAQIRESMPNADELVQILE